MVKEFTPIDSGEKTITPKELAEIQKENLRLKQEVEILKKAMPYSRKSN
jgi:transposase